jgi:hypothetical protein
VSSRCFVEVVVLRKRLLSSVGWTVALRQSRRLLFPPTRVEMMEGAEHVQDCIFFVTALVLGLSTKQVRERTTGLEQLYKLRL